MLKRLFCFFLGGGALTYDFFTCDHSVWDQETLLIEWQIEYIKLIKLKLDV